ncbi:hypothetical protein HXV90_06325 [Lysinibacillus sp. JK80]|uniref:hypothetical protein n=1 Tax=Lysinibacillus sp. JK80 TaxID=2749809 RepID=UPI0022B993CF|nr:hypothetical protein [Lysinibacillus sp. JK80]WBF55490.1 hypothetical protein HXV90_06325 [Lysinibacillus sp. JK80]
MTKYNKEIVNLQEQLFLAQLDEKLKEYEKVVLEKEKKALLAPNTKATYLLHASNFVRWCNGEFMPGDRNKDS